MARGREEREREACNSYRDGLPPSDCAKDSALSVLITAVATINFSRIYELSLNLRTCSIPFTVSRRNIVARPIKCLLSAGQGDDEKIIMI